MKRYIAYNPKYNDDKRHKTYFQHFTEIFSNFVGTHLMCDVTQRADPPPPPHKLCDILCERPLTSLLESQYQCSNVN